MEIRLSKTGVFTKTAYDMMVKCLEEKHFPRFGATLLSKERMGGGEQVDRTLITMMVDVPSDNVEEFVREFKEDYWWAVQIKGEKESDSNKQED